MKRPIASLAVLAVLLLGTAVAIPTAEPKAPKGPPAPLDKGVFIVTYQGHAMATESFTYDFRSDSLTAASEYIQVVRGGDTLRKVTFLVIRESEYDLKLYQSTLTLGRQHKLVRGLTFGDTTVAAFREDDTHGEGKSYRRPPGRIYAMEANSYLLFDVISRNLAGRQFTRWPVQLFSLGEQDTMTEAMATDLGSETIRWGEKPVVARKIGLSEGEATFLMWIGPQKYMLRLEEPNLGLVVERKAPPVKAAKKPTPH